MNGFHQIVLGGGDQILVHLPAARADADPAPTVAVFDFTESTDSADRELVAAAAATLDVFDQALTSISGRGTTAPRRIAVDGTNAVVGRRYWLEDEGGQAQIVTAVGATDAWVEAAAPLSGTFAAGDSNLRGMELRVTIPEAVADLEELLEDDHAIGVRWTYAIGGRLIVVDDQARLVRRLGFMAYVGDAIAILQEEWPELTSLLPRAGSVHSLVKGSARKLDNLLRVHGIDPATFIVGPHGVDILVDHCVWQFGKRGLVPRGGAEPTTWIDEARSSYLNIWNALVKGTPGHDVIEPSRSTDTAPAGHSRRRRNLISPK